MNIEDPTQCRAKRMASHCDPMANSNQLLDPNDTRPVVNYLSKCDDFRGRARVAELADAPDLGSGGETHGGSSPPFRTNSLHYLGLLLIGRCAQFVPT